MPKPATILAAVSALIWLYFWLVRGKFWQVKIFNPPPSGSPARIAAIIPARNEAAGIGQTIASLQGQSLKDQSGAQQLHIFVVDDESSDGTAEAARAAGHAAPLTVIQGQPLPRGWSGKMWAVQQGIESAKHFNPDFFLLTDADIVYSPESVATLLAIMQAREASLASFMVKLHCRSLPEKLLIPAFVFFFFKLYPPRWVADSHRTTAGAAGGCILIRPEALARAGGIAAVRHEIIDDCALAGAVKRSGGKLWLGLTPSIHSTRSYGSFSAIARMISRTAFNQLNHSVLMLVGAIFGLLLTYVVPPAIYLVGHLPAPALAVFAWLLMALCYLPMVRFYGLGAGWALTLPFAAIFYMVATVHSALMYWTNHGGAWKGREQDTAGFKEP